MQADDAPERMRSYLDTSINEKDFEVIQQNGFNLVRLPLGCWNLIQEKITTDDDDTTNQFNKLDSMLSPADYRPYIKIVLDFAQKNS